MIPFDLAVRATEVLLALAFLQQSAEHIFGSCRDRVLFAPRAVLSLTLLTGAYSAWVLLALALHSLWILNRYQGPYNGGSDRMSHLILYCLCVAQCAPSGALRDIAFGYLGLQVILSYFVSGYVKLRNPEWRSGQALVDVFRFSAYPVAESLRGLAQRRKLLFSASWAVILLEVVFPLALLHPVALYFALCLAAAFHVANAVLFGLNRFVWAWIAAFPSVLWLQGRLLQGGLGPIHG